MSAANDDWMKNLIDDWKKKGFAEGFDEARERALEEGRRRGREERDGVLTMRSYLHKLLVSRFGPLPERVEQRIQQSDLATLDAWFEVSLTAPSLETVFPGECGARTA
jgi:hypothetical protein